MEVTRIKNFNLSRRPLISGIYGPGMDDDFVGPDLRRYGLWEMLYLTFRGEGFNVIFYSQDPHYNFFSYRKDDLVEFFNLKPRAAAAGAPAAASATAPSGRYVANINSPFARRRMGQAGENRNRNNLPPDDQENYSQIQQQNDNRLTYYRIANDVDPFATIAHYINTHPERKIVFVFTTAGNDMYEHPERILPQLDNLKTVFNSTNCQAHIVALYGTEGHDTLFEDSEGQLFRCTFFKDALVGSFDPSKPEPNQLYCIAGPGRDEYRNLLNRRRLLEGWAELLNGDGLEAKAVALSQIVTPKVKDQQAYVGDVEKLSHYVKMALPQLQQVIEQNCRGNALEQLRTMAGMEGVRRQLEAFIEALKDARTNPNSVRFRPHLVFSGNPGTGKTTVARLLAKILREEGLLERGHLIEATVGDLEGQYVGETRIKTQALCDRARGGVLFIDEAYGLMANGGAHGESVDYGKEAIEVLIQFMENATDSLVILAGYKSDMENLIKNGNQGFMRRFNGPESFINFEDYQADALYEIFRRKIQGIGTTPEFDDAIRRVITYLHAHRNARWGNAGEMERLASSLLSTRRQRGSTAPLSVDDIPVDKQRLIREDINVDEILGEINALMGLPEVKERLTDLLLSTLGRRKEARERGEIDNKKPNLNYVFEGNPGTGKSTVAGLMAKVLYELGLITELEPAVVDAANLLQPSLGGTPKAVEEMFKNHSGKVIIIDEAYSLANHGTEAIDCITRYLLDPRFEGNQALILAGYTDEMERMLALNKGMRRRFTNIWHFEDYSNPELWTIIQSVARADGFSFEPEEVCRQLAFAYLDRERRRGNQFGNAGTAVALFELLRRAYERRILAGATGRVIRPEYFPGAPSATRLTSPFAPQTATADSGVQPTESADTASAASQMPNAPQVSLTLDADPGRVVANVDDFSHAVGLIAGRKGMGTGFLISVPDRLVVTASHVIEGNPDLLFLMDRGQQVMAASVIWNNPVVDMAIVQCDSLPADAKYFRLDAEVEATPRVLERILHCGYVRGTNVSSNFSTYEGTISNYDPDKKLDDRQFDAIMSGIEAIHGCSGGPVMRAADYVVIGVLQGGFDQAPARVITDIHQIFRQPTLSLK